MFTAKDLLKMKSSDTFYCLLCNNELLKSFDPFDIDDCKGGFAKCNFCKFEYFLSFDKNDDMFGAYITYDGFEFNIVCDEIDLIINEPDNKYSKKQLINLGGAFDFDLDLSNLKFDDIKYLLAYG